MVAVIKQRADYTFKYNKVLGRHGWLRLTPAYSVKLVKELLASDKKGTYVLDPFSGTATTGLVAAEDGLEASLFDINPFLIWLGNTKCTSFSQEEVSSFLEAARKIRNRFARLSGQQHWTPPIHNIERWWCPDTLSTLASLRQAIVEVVGEPSDNRTCSLQWVAFCRLVIETSSAAFNHVSMSFHDTVVTFEVEQIDSLFADIISAIEDSINSPLPGHATVHFGDSRVTPRNGTRKYTHVITSPPYPNRISYIRELRPYMYWTKFLHAAREAGELDWEAIGGTWGVATSRLLEWNAKRMPSLKKAAMAPRKIAKSGEKNASLLAKYVWKYFEDMHTHLDNLRPALRKGAQLQYIVGNSTFYGIRVDTAGLLCESLRSLGYKDIGSRIVRKRNSKKELFEYCVSATWLR